MPTQAAPTPFPAVLRVALALAALLALGPAAAADKESVTLFVPVIVSSSGLNSSFFTSEMVETNKGTSAATVSYAYTDATGRGGTGSATNSEPLGAGRQRVIPDVVTYLRGLGVPIPASGNAVGTLRVTFSNLTAAADAAVTVRTTTPVPTTAPTGRAGLAYFGVPPLGLIDARTKATLCGLRQNSQDRTNVAVQNAGAPGDGDLTLRLTYYPSLGTPSPDVVVTLPPGGFRQYALTDLEPTASNGFVTVSVVSGSASYYAYAVVNDQFNSDGSFVPPLKSGTGQFSAVLVLPSVVETPTYSTEVVLTNLAATPLSGTLVFTSPNLVSAVSLPVILSAYEQRVFPAFIQALRDSHIIGVPPAGGTIVGTLTFTSNTLSTTTCFIGGRTLNAGGGGRYGVFTAGQPDGTGADTAGTWLYGLRQDGTNRTNVALVNASNVDNKPINLKIELYDGGSGILVNTVYQPVSPLGFVQLNAILSQYAPLVTQGYARITRTSGASRFVAYAVVNDGAQPGQRSGDGAVIPMDPFESVRYSGSWQNNTFGTFGSLATTIVFERIPGQILTTTLIGGNALGGTAPGPLVIRGAYVVGGGAVLSDVTPFLGPVSATFLPDFSFSGSAPSVPSPYVSAITFSGTLNTTGISGSYAATLKPSGTATGTFQMTAVP